MSMSERVKLAENKKSTSLLSINCDFKLEHDRDPYARQSSPRCDKCGLCGCADADVFAMGHPQFCVECCPESKRHHLVHTEHPFLNHDPFAEVVCRECKRSRIIPKPSVTKVARSKNTNASDPVVITTSSCPSPPRFKCDDFRVLWQEAQKFNGCAIVPRSPGHVNFRADMSDAPVAGVADFLAELAPPSFHDDIRFEDVLCDPVVAIIAHYCSRLVLNTTFATSDLGPDVLEPLASEMTDRFREAFRKPHPVSSRRFGRDTSPPTTPRLMSHPIDIKRCRLYVPGRESLDQSETKCVAIVYSLLNNARLVFAYDAIPVVIIQRVFSSDHIHTEPRVFTRVNQSDAEFEEELAAA
jgi:ferredoxin